MNLKKCEPLSSPYLKEGKQAHHVRRLTTLGAEGKAWLWLLCAAQPRGEEGSLPSSVGLAGVSTNTDSASLLLTGAVAESGISTAVTSAWWLFKLS